MRLIIFVFILPISIQNIYCQFEIENLHYSNKRLRIARFHTLNENYSIAVSNRKNYPVYLFNKENIVIDTFQTVPPEQVLLLDSTIVFKGQLYTELFTIDEDQIKSVGKYRGVVEVNNQKMSLYSPVYYNDRLLGFNYSEEVDENKCIYNIYLKRLNSDEKGELIIYDLPYVIDKEISRRGVDIKYGLSIEKAYIYIKPASMLFTLELNNDLGYKLRSTVLPYKPGFYWEYYHDQMLDINYFLEVCYLDKSQFNFYTEVEGKFTLVRKLNFFPFEIVNGKIYYSKRVKKSSEHYVQNLILDDNHEYADFIMLESIDVNN